MRVTKEYKSEYLGLRSIPYRTGWMWCEEHKAHTEVFVDPAYQQEFTEGYSDCYANGETAPNHKDMIGYIDMK